MRIFTCVSLSSILCLAGQASESYPFSELSSEWGVFDLLSNAYVQTPGVSDADWEQLKPYFLPENHPAKKKLDKIFKKPKILSSKKSLKKAGFLGGEPRRTGLYVVKHYTLHNYVIKTFLDGAAVCEWSYFLNRVKGAKYIDDMIGRLGYRDILKVPKKWIYPIPVNARAEGQYSKRFILVAEAVDAFESADNCGMYKQAAEKHLKPLYQVITQAKLIDSIYPCNAPFCYDGRIAFIDTEHWMSDLKPIPYTALMPFLSKKGRAIWWQMVTHPQ